MDQTRKEKTIAQHALDVLRETGGSSVCYDDASTLDTIGRRAGMRFLTPRRRWERVLLALGRSPLFVKSFTQGACGRMVRKFTPKISEEK